jgi:5-methylcytosine-specific restriction endonuclease McrA
MCKVSWCSNETQKGKNGQYLKYCDMHIQFRKYATHAPSRPWLMYKVEKVVNNDLVCECCGLDMIKHYKNTNLKAIITAMDVDHINSSIKGTPAGEQPINYQLLCKMCHIMKSYEEGDYVNKKYKNDNK